MNLNANESNGMPRFNFRDLMILLVPIIIFLLYLFVYNPGVLTVTSYSQLHQIATGKFTSGSPVFHTLIEMIFIKIFGSTFYVGLFQIIIFAVMWMAICKYHRDDSLQSSNEFVVQFAITLIICLIPINAVYSITMSSNILFSYSVMFLCFLIKIMIDKNGQIDGKLIILMALTLGIMGGLNNYGILIAVPTLIAITYYLIKKGQSENNYVQFAGLAILCIFLIASLNFVYDVHTDKMKLPTDDSFEHDINLEKAQSQYFSAIKAEPSESYEMATSANSGKGSYSIIDSFVNLWQENGILEILFNNGMLYMILSIALLALIYLKTEANEIFLLYVPPFLNTILVVLTGQNFLYSNILVFYLTAIIYVSFFFKPNLISEYSNRPKVMTAPGMLQSQPRLEAEESYEDDDYYSYLESEIEELTLDDINEMLRDSPREEPQQIKQSAQQAPVKETQERRQSKPQGDSDLLDEILKEIEMGKK